MPLRILLSICYNRKKRLFRFREVLVMEPKPKSPIRRFFRLLTHNCIDHDMGKNAAALAYYLLFAMFPLLIFINNLVGLLDLDVGSITRAMSTVLPTNVVGLIRTYLFYISDKSSPILLSFSLIFTIYFPFRAVKGLMGDVRRAYRLGPPKKPFRYALRQLMFTLVFLLVIIVTLLLAILGQQVLSAFLEFITSMQLAPIAELILEVWQYLRFILAAAIMFITLGLLYGASQDTRQPISSILPGVLTAMTLWIVVSIVFSMYVESFDSFSIIYGTLGAVIVLMSWLYLSAMILILGAELNAALVTIRTES